MTIRASVRTVRYLQARAVHSRAAYSGELRHKVLAGGVSECNGDAQQAVEGRREAPAPVPTPDELVEVAVQVRPAPAVERAHQPPLHIRDGPVDPLQDHVCRHLADDVRVMSVVRQPLVRGIAVRPHHRSRGDVPVDEAMQRRLGVVGDLLHPDTPRLAVRRQFDRAHDGDFPNRAAALAPGGRLPLGPERDGRLVDLHRSRQLAAGRIDHGAAEFRQHQPGRVPAPEAELRLGLLGRHPVRVAGHHVRQLEPLPQPDLGAVHDRPGGHRGLPGAPGALPGETLTRQLPALHRTAFRASETVRPPGRDQVARASGIVRELPVELGPRHRLVLLPTAPHEREHKVTAPLFNGNPAVPTRNGLYGLGLPEPTAGAIL